MSIAAWHTHGAMEEVSGGADLTRTQQTNTNILVRAKAIHQARKHISQGRPGQCSTHARRNVGTKYTHINQGRPGLYSVHATHELMSAHTFMKSRNSVVCVPASAMACASLASSWCASSARSTAVKYESAQGGRVGRTHNETQWWVKRAV